MRALSAIVNNYQFVLFPLNIDMNIEGGLRWSKQSRKYFLVFCQIYQKMPFWLHKDSNTLTCWHAVKMILRVVTIKFVIISASANCIKL